MFNLYELQLFLLISGNTFLYIVYYHVTFTLKFFVCNWKITLYENIKWSTVYQREPGQQKSINEDL